MGTIPSGLVPKLTKVCIDFLAAFPGSTFASGVRSIVAQAGAMADNIVKSGNRKWIAETYRDGAAIRACQHWIDTHPRAVLKAEITAGLFSIFKALTPEELSHVSCHFTGEAIDVALEHDPAKAAWEAKRIAWLKAKATEVGGKFIEEEGGLRKMHFQLRP